MKLSYDITELMPYINWPYFFFAWQVKEQAEKDRLQREANALLQQLAGHYHAYGLFELFDAYGDGDDIVLPSSAIRIPCLRQQKGTPPYLCLSDYISPKQDLSVDISPSTLHPPLSSAKLGVFATSVDIGLETDFDADPYQKMMVQLLADRLAEAAAERMHEQVRKEYWGYAKDEHLAIPDMLVEKFQGIRPAVGYPSLPDTSLNFVLDDLLGMKQIGIRLTESGAMKPHASVSGMMFAHPQARYFSIGKIGEDQLRDYARRRGLPIELCRKFLAGNI
ncbi:MAG: 5-methyltetrahydrofolate--homocysteine methyltransferase [Prevotella sp.]|nr:5-methyltetrahydrofolate--homocysteine methyltransferase [Prevotella sp.]